MGILDRLKEHRERGKRTPLIIDIEKVGSSRAIYQGKNEPPLVHMQLETTDGESIVLEMTSTQTAECIEALAHSYYAINPELRIRRTF